MAIDEKRRAAANAIRTLRRKRMWRPNRGEYHLKKRKAMKHLPSEATMDDYDALIGGLLNEAKNTVYHYPFSVRDYYGVSGKVDEAGWVVIFASDATLETAFPPDDLVSYLANRGFVRLGNVQEVIDERS